MVYRSQDRRVLATKIVKRVEDAVRKVGEHATVGATALMGVVHFISCESRDLL